MAPWQTPAVLRVGLTGGIGAGKSTVARRLAERGALVVDADAIAREVVGPGTEGLADIVAAFGAEVLLPGGTLDRPAVAAIVFADDDARRRLNAIVHPRVGTRTAELLAGAPPDTIVVHDVPLLVENRLAPGFHLVVVVDAPVEARVHRLVEQRGLPEADARARMAAQATDLERRAVADVWLDNTGAPGTIAAAVDALWDERLDPFAANVAAAAGAPRSDPIVVAPDPTWPAQAERLAARVARIAGERAVAVDHVGSTAVPGLSAIDVIDLQLAVASPDDSDDRDGTDDLAADLAAGGFPASPEHAPARLHVNADPGRAVDLHVRAVGSPGWRTALLLRDWRRADATEPSLDPAVARAEAWAERTGWTPTL